MYYPATRILTIIDLLQSHGEMTGKELSHRLQVDQRTVRRYITMLQDMGIPVEAERGRSGAYYLRPGYKLPPLMFNHEEALAVVLSLRIAQQTALHGAGITVEGAMAKIERVLPEALKQQVREVVDNLKLEMVDVQGVETSAQVIQTVSTASRQHRQIYMHHTAFNGTVTERTVDPYGVAYRVGRWYMVGYCHLRSEMRTFRLDRVLTVKALDTTFEPQQIDLMAHIEQALASTPGIHRVEIVFQASAEMLRQYVSPAVGQVTTVDETTVRLSCFVQHLGWFAGFLAGIPLPYKIIQPPALHHEMRQMLTRLQQNLNE